MLFGLPRELSYDSFVGLYFNRNRAFIQKSYMITLGMSEFYNMADMDDEWVDAVTDNEFDAAELAFEINADRWSARQKRAKGGI